MASEEIATEILEVVHDDLHHESISRIVAIGLDASEHSSNALKWAVSNMLKPVSDLVVLINVFPVAVVPGPYGESYMAFSAHKLDEHYRSQSHNLLKSAAAYLNSLGFAVKAFSMRGDPRDELTRKVEELQVDLLVIGSRGLGAIKRVFIGSTSDHLIHHAHCPVLVVKDFSDSFAKQKVSAIMAEPVPSALHS